MTAPRIFLSHAWEDKERFVEPLARLLRARGLDAWYDAWEIAPGDSLPQKIFDEGLGVVDNVVVVLSAVSVSKPWVRAELDVAVVRNIEDKVRLIPVKLEECDVPTSLKAKLYVDVLKEGSLERVAERIDNVVRGVSAKPPLGAPKGYAELAPYSAPDLDATDAAALWLLYKEAIATGDLQLATNTPLRAALEEGMTEEAFGEAVEILDDRGIIRGRSAPMGSKVMAVVELPAATLLKVAAHDGVDIDALQARIAAAILNDGVNGLEQLVALSDAPKVVVAAVLERFEELGFLRVARTIGGDDRVNSPSAAFSRWLRTRSQTS